MLLPSDRHTRRDLDHWSGLAKGDALRGATLERSGRPAKGIESIRRFVADGPCYVGTSWGKDSVVVCHMVARSGVRVPVVHIVQEGPNLDPEQHLVRDAFLARWDIDYHEIAVEPQVRAQREAGHTPALDIGIRRAQERWGKRWISGLRAAESGVRKLRAKIGSESSCWPIAWWSTPDVYGYIEHHRIPLHPAYACTEGGMWDRDWIRVSIIGGEKGQQHGRRDWEWRYYPEVMRRIEEWKHANDPR